MAGDEESQNRLNIMRDMQIPEENIFVEESMNRCL